MLTPVAVSALPSPPRAACGPAPRKSDTALADRFESKANHQERIGDIFTGAGMVSGDVGAWVAGIGLGVAGAYSSGVVGCLVGATLGAVGATALGLGLGAVGHHFDGKAVENHNLAKLARGEVPKLDMAELPAADGSHIRIGMNGYHGMGSDVDTLLVQYLEKDAATPKVELLTSHGYFDMSVGAFHATARALDGKVYHLVTQYPQSGLESFDTSHPAAARLVGPDLNKTFVEPPATNP